MCKKRKVVIHEQWGGFHVPHEVMMLYAKKKGIRLYPYISWKGNVLATEEEANDPKNRYFLDYSEKQADKVEYEELFDTPDREDPYLIAALEDFQSKGGECSLTIKTIPWWAIWWVIEEYDGYESIEVGPTFSAKHRIL